jgi:hypothetical protein
MNAVPTKSRASVSTSAAKTRDRSIPPSIARSVYSGRERLGSFQQINGDFVAFDRRGRKIGRFDTAIEAANAITEQAGVVP